CGSTFGNVNCRRLYSRVLQPNPSGGNRLSTRKRLVGVVSVASWLMGLGSCSDVVLERRPFTEPEDTVLIVDRDAGSPAGNELSTDAPAVLGVDPTHGPFNGGQSAIIRGNGFTSAARVWLGGQELAPGNVVALDPNRLQVVVPPGPPGPVDVS